jgi:cytochrome c-type biogenesis protein CcmH
VRLRDRRSRTALLAVVIGVLALEPLALALTPANQAEYELAATTILCDCGCHPQSVHDCACGRADEMRRELAALVDSGMSGEAIIAKYVAEHGEKIRIAPTATGFNLVAWVGPLIGLVLAAGGLALVLRRWRREAVAAEPAAATTPVADAAARARLEQALRDFE